MLYVLPPDLRVILALGMLPNAELTQIFGNDLAPLQLSVGGLNSTVLAATEAVIFKVGIVAASALPKDITRSELKQIAEVLLNLLEVNEERNGAIRGRREPVVNCRFVELRHDELTHEYQLVSLLL